MLPFDVLMAALLGIGGTVVLDAWSLFQSRVLKIPSLDYRLVGRWLVLMPSGRFTHSPIGATPPVPLEVMVGWTAHYLIGVVFGVVFIFLVGADWLMAPKFIPAALFGMATVAAPYFVMQPALGAGFAALKTPNPSKARFLSLTAHTVFGIGLYLSAWGLNTLTR